MQKTIQLQDVPLTATLICEKDVNKQKWKCTGSRKDKEKFKEIGKKLESIEFRGNVTGGVYTKSDGAIRLTVLPIKNEQMSCNRVKNVLECKKLNS